VIGLCKIANIEFIHAIVDRTGHETVVGMLNDSVQWLWVLFVLFGFGKLSVNWATGLARA
jgi:hypothetical protein